MPNAKGMKREAKSKRPEARKLWQEAGSRVMEAKRQEANCEKCLNQ